MIRTIFILFICISTLFSCKEKIEVLKGDFIFHKDAAVLQTKDKIYGVLITDKLHELNKLAEQYKKEPTDMVQIEIKGRVTNKKDEKILWEDKVEVIEILNVTQQKKENSNVIKLGS